MRTEQTISVWQNRVRMRVLSEGQGPALVYCHGPWGLNWDPFLSELAKRLYPAGLPPADAQARRLDQPHDSLFDLKLPDDPSPLSTL